LLAKGWPADSILLAVALLPAGGVLLMLGLALRPAWLVAGEPRGA
jgi:hypothetical protein